MVRRILKQDFKISIVLPTYNRAHIISRAIKSVITQTYLNWELIIVDDNSIDKTEEIVSSYSSNDNRIIYFRNKFNKGPSGARNYGISLSKGDYIAFLDSDDEWLPFHLSEGINAILSSKKPLFIASWDINQDGVLHKHLSGRIKIKFDQMLLELNIEKHNNYFIFEPYTCEYITINRISFYHINTIIVEKKFLCGMSRKFNEKLYSSEDIEFIFRCIGIEGFCYSSKSHFIYNMGNDNVYNFINRDNIDLKKILLDKNLINKMCHCDKNKCLMFKLRKKEIKKDKKIIEKQNYINYFNERLSMKYFTLSIILQKNKKLKSLYFMFLSIFYKNKKYKWNYLFELVFKSIVVPPMELTDFY